MILVYLARLVFHLHLYFGIILYVDLTFLDMTGTQHHRKGTASDARVVLPHGAFEGQLPMVQKWLVIHPTESPSGCAVIPQYTTGRHTVRNIPMAW